MNIEINKICNIAKEAGFLIKKIYDENDHQVEFKSDKSPLTIADKASHEIINRKLTELYPDIPIISEEGKNIPFGKRSLWGQYWLIDPLDGTKEFIKKIDEFTVNIALIEDAKPVIGVIYLPVQDILYYAQKNKYAWKQKQNMKPKKINTNHFNNGGGFHIIKSRSHPSPELERFLKAYKINKSISMGSSIKFCMLAEGKADIYPRLGPTREWDTGAGHCIVEEAGGIVVDNEHNPLIYNKENLLHNNFIVYSSYEMMLHKPKSSDIPYHHATIKREHREKQNQHRSVILWFTGLSGAGKSTLAHSVEDKLHRMGCRTYVFDGDNVRHGLNRNLGFSKKDRQENLRRIGEMCKLFIDAGVIALAAFISPYKDDRDKIRKLVKEGDFIEIFCDCSLEVCEARDIKGHYKKARSGEIKDFTGISAPYEKPETPEVKLNTGKKSLIECVEEIAGFLERKKYL